MLQGFKVTTSPPVESKETLWEAVCAAVGEAALGSGGLSGVQHLHCAARCSEEGSGLGAGLQRESRGLLSQASLWAGGSHPGPGLSPVSPGPACSRPGLPFSPRSSFEVLSVSCSALSSAAQKGEGLCKQSQKKKVM